MPFSRPLYVGGKREMRLKSSDEPLVIPERSNVRAKLLLLFGATCVGVRVKLCWTHELASLLLATCTLPNVSLVREDRSVAVKFPLYFPRT
jgi:hypothetical protein